MSSVACICTPPKARKTQWNEAARALRVRRIQLEVAEGRYDVDRRLAATIDRRIRTFG
jgi:anti-sigma28 factor (negative regulator of flagellin synthesis)